MFSFFFKVSLKLSTFEQTLKRLKLIYLLMRFKQCATQPAQKPETEIFASRSSFRFSSRSFHTFLEPYEQVDLF